MSFQKIKHIIIFLIIIFIFTFSKFEKDKLNDKKYYTGNLNDKKKYIIDTIQNSILYDTNLLKSIYQYFYISNFYDKEEIKLNLNIDLIDTFINKSKIIDTFKEISILDSNLLKDKIIIKNNFKKNIINFLKKKEFYISKKIDKIKKKNYTLWMYKRQKKMLDILFNEEKIKIYFVGNIHLNKNFNSIIFSIEKSYDNTANLNSIYLMNYKINSILSLIKLSEYTSNLFSTDLIYSKIDINNIPKIKIYQKNISSDYILVDKNGEILDKIVPPYLLYEFILDKNGFFKKYEKN